MFPVTPVAPVSTLGAPIYWLALGTFAIGTEGFMIVPLLPKISADLAVSISTAGQLVTVFTLAFALSSPILTALTGRLNRRKLLILSMTAFALANVVAWASQGYWGVMGARVLLAFASGLFAPNANALAGALVSRDKRGRALSIVNGGTTIAIVLGLPLGALIGDRFGWRMTFLGVGVLAAIATAGLVFGLNRNVGDHLPVASLRERLAVARRPAVLLALLITAIWATGAYTVWTYIAPYLTATTGFNGTEISGVVLLWGLAAAAGVFAGGHLNDKFGSRSVMIPALSLLALAFVALSVWPRIFSQSDAVVPVLGAIIVWGLAAWGFFPAQQARLIEIGGHRLAPVVLSLNASFMFAGFSAGAALGSWVLASSSSANLGWAGAGCELAALLLLLVTSRSPVKAPSMADN